MIANVTGRITNIELVNYYYVWCRTCKQEVYFDTKDEQTAKECWETYCSNYKL